MQRDFDFAPDHSPHKWNRMRREIPSLEDHGIKTKTGCFCTAFDGMGYYVVY
jgi:hypothetical protein